MTIKDRDRLFARCEGLEDLPNLLRAIVEGLPVDHPQPGKVRCWRHKKGPFDCLADRLRWTGTEMEWVHPDGSIAPTSHTIETAETAVIRGWWLECPDEPYRPAPVPAQATTMPDCVRELVKQAEYPAMVFDIFDKGQPITRAIAAVRAFYGEVQP